MSNVVYLPNWIERCARVTSKKYSTMRAVQKHLLYTYGIMVREHILKAYNPWLV